MPELLTTAVALLLLVPAVANGAEDAAAEARKLLFLGRYAEAEDAYGKLPEGATGLRARGLAECLAARGEDDQAREVIAKAIAGPPGKKPAEKQGRAALHARLARFAFDRGDYPAADEAVKAALKLDSNQAEARWIKGELHRVRGELKEADREYFALVEFYNATDEAALDADALRWIGLAAAQYARWNRLADQFQFLVNDLYPAASQAGDKEGVKYWPANYEMGRLFLEKYNEAEAQKQLKAALVLNPNAADVHAAVAQLAIQNFELDAAEISIRAALGVNPRHRGVLLARADMHLANFAPERAVEALEEARKLNPVSEATLGRLAATVGMLDGLKDDPSGTRMGELIEEALARNPHCGEFYFALAEALDKGRKYPYAAKYFDEAARVMPQLVGPTGQAGLMYLRLGEEERGEKLLKESFEADPFNVRVSNSLKVLEVLAKYDTLETEHFIIRFDGAKDKVLAAYAGRRLEAIYPEICRRLDYEPAEKTLFEIFNRAKNTDGHGWFSARMVGLPAVHTIGACAGRMVALASPTSMKQSFNWARVLKHEFVHVVNLQQTNFNIPHWYTEALAVLLEDQPRSAEWNELLARRVAADKVFHLDTINLGFIRPASSEDWQLAYCQAELYAEYLVARFGEDSLAKMLAGYRDNLNTAQAIERAFSVSVEDFERGYGEHVRKAIQAAPIRAKGAEAPSLAKLTRDHEEHPDDLDIAAQLALAHLKRKAYAEAGPLVEKVLEKEPKHQLATYVRASLMIVIGQGKQAYALLEAALDRESPQPELLRLLAGLKLKAEDFAGAEDLYELGRTKFPGDAAWVKALAAVQLKAVEEARLAKTLEALLAIEPDDALTLKKLAEMAWKSRDFPATVQWANRAVDIDVQDAETHRMLGEALLETGDAAGAVFALEAAAALAPDDDSVKSALEKSRGQLKK